MTARAKPKPTAATETRRVLNILRWLTEEVRPEAKLAAEESAALIVVADRIAMRTED